jgi:uracil-DNA glycosylase
MKFKPIVLVGEARGEHEDKYKSCFVGPSGAMLLRMLNKAEVIRLSAFDKEFLSRWYTAKDPKALESIWSLHPEVYRTNVFQIHPPKNDLDFFTGPKAQALAGFPALTKKYVRQEFITELERLRDEIILRDPNIIICLGNTAIWALAGRTGITKLRGTTLLSTHTVEGFKLLPTLHPASLMYQGQYNNHPTVIADLQKAHRESEFPEIRRLAREIWIEPTLADIQFFHDAHIHGCSLLSVDIETSGSRITCIGFSPSARIAIVIPFDDERRPNRSYWPTEASERECWAIVRHILGDPSIPKLFQNGLYDISFLYRAYGIKTFGAEHDTMLLQHALQPESLKGLGYLGSLYTDEFAWKNMRKRVKTIKRDN